MSPIRIVVIHQDGLLTGSGRSLLYMLMGLDAVKFDIHVILGGDGPLNDLLRRNGFNVTVFRLTGFWTAPGPKWYRPGALKNLLSLFRNRGLAPLVAKLKPDIIHLNDKALVPAGLRLRHLGIPIVQHLRSTYHATYIRAFARLSRKAIEKYASLLIAISEDEADEFRTFSEKIVIFNSMDTTAVGFDAGDRKLTRDELGVRADEKLILFIGLFTATKGAWDFIDMVGYLKRTFGSGGFRFVMVGPVPENGTSHERTLRKKLMQNNIVDEIIFAGFRNDILRVIHASDAAVICNRLGAMGRQAFEVLSVGRPLLITSGRSGKSTIVTDRTGVVTEPGDSRRMAIELKALMGDPDRMARISIEGRKHAQESFDYRRNGRLLGAAYLKLLKQGLN